ncbi:peptidylprolyl isomerase [Marinospirillum alkaliphilum]|uniref:Chaperone SurA n=1 Tax=Marinospirillum alkaliphilum DSM 21637 TaxID=1122209 RepID=A0A1K1VHI3_9GAMM|nr:peptidylprolyl isomerase [Marinospirillum alkaliphilum]SFX24503.1 peptidyl-prolyl cis-trans isomerase SurA [Marinospirillum alkaliphilum DSM 21637]
MSELKNASRVMAGLLMLLLCGITFAEPRLLDRVVAVVDREALMESELQQRMQQVRGQIADRGLRAPPEAVLRQQVLDRLILDTIQLQLARQAGMRIDEQTLNQTLTRIARQNQMDLRQFSQAIEADGMSFAAFREQIRQEMLISQVRQRRVGDRIQVSQQEIENYLASPEALEQEGREFRVGHILVQVPDNPTPEQIGEAQRRAEALKKRLDAGEDFQEMAISSSAGDEAFSGGDLGWRAAAALPSLFADQVVRLPVGGMAGPIRSPSGFHLIKLLETRGGAQHLVDQTRARHLLLSTNALRDEQATLNQLRELRQRISRGESLADLAREYSDDRGSKQSGGSLGWVSPGQMVPAFEQAMNQLAVGEVSEPVQSQFGWHLILVEERRKSDMTDNLRRQQVRQLLSERRFEEEVQNWLREIRDSTWVEIRE